MTSTDLAGSAALITGATSGIGRATAVQLARRGAHVLVSGRDPGRGEAAVDAIRAAGGHGGCELGDQDEGGLDVDGVHGVDVGVAGVRRRPEGEDAGVVDEDVDVAAAQLDGPASERANRVDVGQVRGDEVGFPAHGADSIDRRLATSGITPADEDVRAASSQPDGRCASDAAGCAGDQGRAPGKVGGSHVSSFRS